MVIDSNRFSMLFSKDVYILIIFCNFIIILFIQKYRKNLENKLEKFHKITDKNKIKIIKCFIGWYWLIKDKSVDWHEKNSFFRENNAEKVVLDTFPVMFIVLVHWFCFWAIHLKNVLPLVSSEIKSHLRLEKNSAVQQNRIKNTFIS